MRIKRQLNFGDIFLTWEVIELVNPKKYRYLCRCTECGIEKEFIKYNLLKGSYSPCKKCGHKKIKNIPLIKKHWNCELNGVLFDNPENFSLTQSYWFLCAEGHNFKCSIKDFSLNRCTSCKEHPPIHPTKIKTKEFIFRYFKAITSVSEIGDFTLMIPEFNLVIHLEEDDRYRNHRNYFSGEAAMLKDIDYVKNLELTCKDDGIEFKKLHIGKNFKNNIDTFRSLMVELNQQLCC